MSKIESLRPSKTSLLIFFLPSIFIFLMSLFSTLRYGISFENILYSMVLTYNLITPFLSILCILFPGCTGFSGDSAYFNPIFYAFSVFIVVFIWYLVSLMISKKLDNVKVKHPNLISLKVFVLLIALLLIGSYYVRKIAVYSVNKGISLYEKDIICEKNVLKVELVNDGYEKIEFSDISIQVDGDEVDCIWEGKLTPLGTAYCVYRIQNTTYENGKPRFSHKMKIKHPSSTMSRSFTCSK